METKKCTKCGEVKSFSEFGKDKQMKLGIKSRCKKCESAAAKEYRERNPEKYKESKKKYNNSEKGKAKNREWIANNPDKVKAKKAKYRSKESARVKERESKKEYRSRPEVKEKIREYDREHHKTRMMDDVLYKCKHMTRGIIGGAFRRMGFTKKSRSYEILGCDWDFF